MFKRGIDTYAKHVCRRRRDGSQYFPLFVLFVLFGQAKRTLKEKYHKVTFPLSYFCVTKRRVQGGEATSERRRRDGVSGKSHLRGFSILLKIFFRRLAATSANKVPRPSNRSLVTATGSKRSSADSDLLLCHVRLWRTSRFKFGCVSWCEHSEIGGLLIVPSAHGLHPRPLTLSRRRRPRLLRKSVNSRTFSGRADNACTNLLGFFV